MEGEKGGGKKFLHIFNKWIKVPLEIIGFFVVILHLIPPKWEESHWLLFSLILVAILGLFIANYLLVLRSYNIESKLKKKYENEVAGITTELSTKIKELEWKSRYADVFPLLNGAFQELHNAIRKNHDDKTKYHEHLVVCCHNLERVFSTITGHECHVSIKMTQFPQDKLPAANNKANKNVPEILLRTYCRSSSASSTRTQIDFQKHITHPVKENTDFEYIYANHDHYFCNDLTQLDIYKNSSLKDKTGGDYIIYPKTLANDKAWPLDYKAVLVAPISPIIKETREDKIILGFLCVDCKIPGVFNEEYDKHILIGCADGIYNSFYNIFNKPTVTNPKN